MQRTDDEIPTNADCARRYGITGTACLTPLAQARPVRTATYNPCRYI